MSLAWRVSDRSGRVIDRDTTNASSTAAPTVATVSTISQVSLAVSAVARTAMAVTITSASSGRAKATASFRRIGSRRTWAPRGTSSGRGSAVSYGERFPKL